MPATSDGLAWPHDEQRNGAIGSKVATPLRVVIDALVEMFVRDQGAFESRQNG